MFYFFIGGSGVHTATKISELQDSLQLLTGKDAYVIGVTPETGENINKTVDKTHASFSIVQDKGYKIMKAYQVNYTVDSKLLTKLRKYGVDIEKNNGNTDHVLPVLATYIIARSGKIAYVYFDAKNFTKRASVRSLLAALDGV